MPQRKARQQLVSDSRFASKAQTLGKLFPRTLKGQSLPSSMTKRFLQTQQSELYQNAWPARAFGAINQYVKRRYVKSEVPAWETPEATERQKASSPESRG